MDEAERRDRPDVDSSRERPVEEEDGRAVGNAPFGSETFCILPWIHTFIDVNGDVKLCCLASAGLQSRRGRAPLSLQQRPLREIWNSAEMKEVRRKMLSGQKVGACSRCNKEDALGQVSYRQHNNQYWLGAHPDRERWRRRVEDSVTRGDEVQLLPAYYDIRPGNLCTLKCRMCHSDYSNLIRDDPVHSQWAYQSAPTASTRFSDGKAWYQAEDVVIDELLENVQETRMFYLAGGEPLVNPFIRKLIDTLVDRGVASQVGIEVSTNATVIPKPLLEKLTKFAFVRLFLSIDGYGSLYEYIRYPGKWDNVSRIMEELGQRSEFSCTVITTVQNYNVLSLTEIFRFSEALNLPCNFNLVYSPVYLSIRTMPREAQEIAARRLRSLKDYAEKSPVALRCPGIVPNIANVISELDQDSERIYTNSLREFMTFTNDLDRSRGQRFRQVCPELYELIASDGTVWDDDLRRAGV